MSKSCQLRMYVTAAIPAPAKANPMKTVAGQREQRPPRLDETEREDDGEEADRVDQAAEEGKRRLPDRDVPRPERRREHGVVELLVAELPEDVGRVVERAVERGGGEQRRRDEGGVLDRLRRRSRPRPT